MPKNLITGFKDFLNENYECHNDLMQKLVSEGQDPEYFIVSCIDSRTHAGTIFKTKPGMFFAHKSMGAIIRKYKTGTTLAASLQFALLHNNVKTIVIMGHTGCGAVQALINDVDDPEIASFIKVAQEGLDKAKQDTDNTKTLQRLSEEHILRLSRRNIEGFPSVQKRLQKGDLKIKTWLFDMHGGALFELNTQNDQFETLVKKEK